jgi:Nif-specific regulatory protein
VAATNRNLVETVRSGKFREDLFYRLTVVTLQLSPLRDRRDDILPLAEHFLDQFCRDARRKPLVLSPAARARLAGHEWPGNVRELRNLMERVAFLCPNQTVEPADLSFSLSLAGASAVQAETVAGAEYTLSAATDEFQRQFIQTAIDRTKGNLAEAGRLLGLHRSNLYRKMRQLGMNTKSEEP